MRKSVLGGALVLGVFAGFIAFENFSAVGSFIPAPVQSLIRAQHGIFPQKQQAQIPDPNGVVTEPYTPDGRTVTPWSYGFVTQTLVGQWTGQTGQQICQQMSPPQNCISVSGAPKTGPNGSDGPGYTCSQPIQSTGDIFSENLLVSCHAATTNTVNESNFQPVNCNANGTDNQNGGWNGVPLINGIQEISSMDWCVTPGAPTNLGPSLMPNRLGDTLYQYDDYVRLGVNKRFGGTIMELYGVDGLDRIMQNGGGATQLSLWGQPPQSNTYQTFFMTPEQGSNVCSNTVYFENTCGGQQTCNGANGNTNCCQGAVDSFNVDQCNQSDFSCGGNGWSAGGPLNPIQAQGTGCSYGWSQGFVDSVTSPAPGQLTISKANPSNFTKSTGMSGLTWTQTSSVVGGAAKVNYNMKYNGPYTMDYEGQEIPAIFTHAGIGTSVYYYAGSSPYSDSTSQVTHATVSPVAGQSSININYVLPQNLIPAQSSEVALTESWISVCDSAEVECITLASFSPLGRAFAFGFNYDPNNMSNANAYFSYLGMQGRFQIFPGMDVSSEVYFFPYRFDDLVNGKSIRERIYHLRNWKGTKQEVGPLMGSITSQVGTTLYGYACNANSEVPVQNIQVFAGDPSNNILLASGADNAPNGQAVQQICGSPGTGLGFQITIPTNLAQQYANSPLYVTAGTGTGQITLTNSGVYNVPYVMSIPANTGILYGTSYPMGPQGNPNLHIVFQGDANLVVYQEGTNAVLWAMNNQVPHYPLIHDGCSQQVPGTQNYNKCTLAFQGDGNLVIYDDSVPQRKAIWSDGIPSVCDPVQGSACGATLVLTSNPPYIQVLDYRGVLQWWTTHD